LEPCWPPFSAQDGPRGLQDAPRCLPSLQDLTKTFPRHPKPCPYDDFGMFFFNVEDVWKNFQKKMPCVTEAIVTLDSPLLPDDDFGTILKRLWKIFERFDSFCFRFLVDVGHVLKAKLGPCWLLFSAQDSPKTSKTAKCTTRTRYVLSKKSLLAQIRFQKRPA